MGAPLALVFSFVVASPHETKNLGRSTSSPKGGQNRASISTASFQRSVWRGSGYPDVAGRLPWESAADHDRGGSSPQRISLYIYMYYTTYK